MQAVQGWREYAPGDDPFVEAALLSRETGVLTKLNKQFILFIPQLTK